MLKVIHNNEIQCFCTLCYRQKISNFKYQYFPISVIIPSIPRPGDNTGPPPLPPHLIQDTPTHLSKDFLEKFPPPSPPPEEKEEDFSEEDDDIAFGQDIVNFAYDG